jgi:hypothetical protein
MQVNAREATTSYQGSTSRPSARFLPGSLLWIILRTAREMPVELPADPLGRGTRRPVPLPFRTGRLSFQGRLVIESIGPNRKRLS